MDPLIALILGLLAGAVLGVVLGLVLATVLGRSGGRFGAGGRYGSASDGSIEADAAASVLEARHAAEIQRVLTEESERRGALREQLAAAQATMSALDEQLGAAQEQYRELVERHRAERLEQAEKERAESRVLQALAPVNETLAAMQRKVAELEEQRSAQHGQISEQLRSATESEERLRSTAETLASALRANNTRGVWGETQLRRVVEAAGLIERVDFDLQSNIVTDAGAGRPDMVVRLPGGKNIAVDAKVPFTAYLEATSIRTDASAAEQARRHTLLAAHVKAVREHIVALGSKTYWQGLPSSPELVIAFIPSESLISSALESDPSLLEFAFSKRVALASPVTLWSVLKTVAFSWQQDVLTAEAKQLFDLSRELHGRLATTATHIDKLGRSLERSVKDYNGFVGSLERQVLPSARKLSALDETKIIPQLTVIDEPTRKATAYELIAQSPDEPTQGSEDSEEDDSSAGHSDDDGRIPEDVRSRAESTTNDDTSSPTSRLGDEDVKTLP